MKDIKVVAFDCDGVMFDSQNANRAYYDHLLDRFGLPPMTPEQLAYVHMHTVDESLAFLMGDRIDLEAQPVLCEDHRMIDGRPGQHLAVG